MSDDMGWYRPPTPKPCPPPEGLTIPVALRDKTELLGVLDKATIEYFKAQERFGDDAHDDDCGCCSCHDTRGGMEETICRIKFDEATVTVSTKEWGQGCFSGGFVTISYVEGQNEKETVLVRCVSGEDREDEASMEAIQPVFTRLKVLLGLPDCSSSELLAALISRSMPIDDFMGIDDYWSNLEDYDGVPTYLSALELLPPPAEEDIHPSDEESFIISARSYEPKKGFILVGTNIHVRVKKSTRLSAIAKTYASTVGIALPSLHADHVFCLFQQKPISGDPTVSDMKLKEGYGIEVWKKKDMTK